MKSSLRLLLACACLGAALPSASADIASELNGKLVALQEKSALPFAAKDLPQEKYFALYFSAGWCGPCHQFTPQLVKFYNEMKPKYPDFEVIFVSRDESANQMEKYMAEMQMPWPGLRYNAAKSDRTLNKYCGPGIPCLVLINQSGEVLSDSFAGSKYLGPYKVMSDLKKLLGEGSGALASEASPAALAPTATPVEKSSANSPSGTDWDAVFKKKTP